MGYFFSKLKEHIQARGFSFYSLQEHIDIPENKYYMWRKSKKDGGRLPTDEDLERLSKFKALELNIDQLKSWRIRDQYTKDQILMAAQAIIEEDKDI